MSLSPLQFGPQEPLPGMEETAPFAVHSAWAQVKPAVQEHFDQKQQEARAGASGPVMDQWTGPDPHQRVMGVHDLADNHGQPDVHGFIRERKGFGSLDPRHDQEGMRSPDENFLGRGGNGVKASDYMKRYGGGRAKQPAVLMHWAGMPTRQVRSDALIHTTQSTDETELGKNHFDPEFARNNPGRREGRERVNAIRSDVESGNPIHNPAWLIKHNNRLFSVDGHHRILAAREGGLETFPAKVWDLDAARKKR